MKRKRPRERTVPNPPNPRWECRYSSAEMFYLELTATDVKTYLDHPSNSPDITTFEEVLAGKMDAEVRNLFGAGVLEELKAAVRKKLNPPPASMPRDD